MKKKGKYLIIVLILIMIFPKNIYANETLNCYYATDDGNFMYILSLNDYEKAKSGNKHNYSDGIIYKRNGELCSISSDPKNLAGSWNGFSGIYTNRQLVQNEHMKSCPSYVSIKTVDGVQKKYVVASNNKSELSNSKKYSGTIANNITEEEFSSLIVGAGTKKDSNITIDSDFITCSELFSSKMLEYVNTVLSIMRWIAVGLVVVLTTIDIFNAVLSSSEDKMKKAQELAIKRLIAGVAVFLVPLFVNLCFSIAEDIYVENGYEVCEINFK